MGRQPTTGIWLVAIGGAIGSALRYYAYTLFGARPLTTFAVNIFGSFLIGVLAATTNHIGLRVFLGTGILGGFTTFSALQLEALAAAPARGIPFNTLTILIGSLSAGFTACWCGFALGQRLIR